MDRAPASTTGRGPAFAYEERLACVCGASLAGAGEVVDRAFAWGRVRFAGCGACGSWCQSPQLAAGSLAAWLDSPMYRGTSAASGVAYADYLADEAARVVEAEGRYARSLKRVLPGGARVLEVGCATGSLLQVLRRQGCDVVGVDLSPVFAEAAKRWYGLEVVLGDVRAVALPRHHFDAVLLFGTIGNVQDLPGALARLREALKPGGLLVFNHPDAGSPLVRWGYRARHWMFTPSVNCFMTRAGGRAVLGRSGFEVLAMERDWQQPSLRKLIRHARLDRALGWLPALERAKARVPVALPIPGVTLVRARAAGAA